MGNAPHIFLAPAGGAFPCQGKGEVSLAQGSTALPWEVPLCGTRLNPHFLFVLPKRKRPFMVKRKDARDELTDGAANSPKTGTGRHELPTELETPLPAALYLNLKSVRRRICGHGAQRGANRTPSASLSAAAPPSNSGRGFQRRDRSPAPLCHEGAWGTGGVPHSFGWGLRGGTFAPKAPSLPRSGNCLCGSRRFYLISR